ncbi:MAG: hypothetical protein ACLQDL_10525 [Spirochaetia bacterium]
MIRPRSLLPVLAASFAVLTLLASCASVPQRTPSEWLGVLPPDASMYVSFSVPGSVDLVRKALKDAGPDFQNVGALMDRTKRLVGAVTLRTGSSVRFDVAALGGYPAGIIGMQLRGNKEWTETTSPSGTYWQWSKAGLQMAIPNNGIFLASNGGIDGLLARWASPVAPAIPPDAAQDMLNSDFVLYMPELPGNLTETAAQRGLSLPIREVWMNAVKGKDGFELSGTVNTSSALEAKVLALALRLGLVAWMRSQEVTDAAERLKTVTVSPVGLQVKLAGLHVTDAEIIPLFLSFVRGLNAPAAPGPAAAVSSPDAPDRVGDSE